MNSIVVSAVLFLRYELISHEFILIFHIFFVQRINSLLIFLSHLSFCIRPNNIVAQLTRQQFLGVSGRRKSIKKQFKFQLWYSE